MADSSDLVLVTGASGYIATHVVQQLQSAGYRVRGTVRSLKNEEKVKPIRELCPNAKHTVELVEADLLDPQSWNAAVQDCTYVLHIASPFLAESPQDESVYMKPAVDGTVNVLQACKEAKTVKRVVLTSSVAAISQGFDLGGNFNEENWTDDKVKNINLYLKSKTLAERAAWDFIKELNDDEKFELVVINPAYVMGPLLCGSFTTSMEIPKRLLQYEIPMLPKLNFPVVDVRDVAEAHVKAMTAEDAAGKRHIICSSYQWMADMGKMLSEEFTPQGYKIPTKVAPYALFWLVSCFDKSVKILLPSIGKVTHYDTTRMETVLGIKPREFRSTLFDMCYSMIEAGKVKKTEKYSGPKYSSEYLSTLNTNL